VDSQNAAPSTARRGGDSRTTESPLPNQQTTWAIQRFGAVIVAIAQDKLRREQGFCVTSASDDLDPTPLTSGVR